MADFHFDNSYARDLGGLWLKAAPAHAPQPRLIRFNHRLAHELRLDLDDVPDEGLAAIFAGASLPAGAEPLAMAYAGHQFGHFNPQLGDGRAILLGEVIDANGARRDIQLKGAGRTPFSRGGDGLAALGPVLREYLVSEFMHAAGVPATRALAAVLTGASVWRETELSGAVLTRVASSHIRIGTFQFFAARGDLDALRRLASHAMARHYPDALDAERPHLAFFEAVLERQAKLIAHWTSLGFVHGVMNTDNMAISGETIDFGPCAFMDHYDPHALFSSIDQHGRYAFSSQPGIASWNLARLAETLVPLVDPNPDKSVALLTAALERFQSRFEVHRLALLRRRFGLSREHPGDAAMFKRLFDQMQAQAVDYSIAMRRLARGESGAFSALFSDGAAAASWWNDWLARLHAEGSGLPQASAALLAANPAYIPRNHRIEEAIAAAQGEGDLAPFQRLADVLARPFDEQPEHAQLHEAPRPDQRVTRTFCGT